MKKVKVVNRDGFIIDDGVIISSPQVVRKEIYFHYLEKFFNKFLNKFEFTGLSYQQVAYIMRQFWSQGTVGCFIRKDWDIIKDSIEFDEFDKIVFAPWVWNDRINIYNFPTKVTFVNTRAVSFIPSTPFELDKEAVIGYILRNKKSVFSIFKSKLLQLVDIEMTMRTALKIQKTPWVIACSPEDEAKLKKLFERIENDEDAIYTGVDDIKNIKALVSGGNYTLDKLYEYKQAIENEILTLLGINNIGILQKKEHLTVGEVEENDEQIQASNDEFLSMLEEFFERVNDVLGYRITIKLKQEIMIEENKEEKKEDEENA